MVITLTKENFVSEVIESDIPVLVDFWAAWCGPCKMVSPIIDELADDYKGKIKVYKLNVDEYNIIAAQYNVMSIPTVFIFKNGKPVEKLVGVRPITDYKLALDKYI